MINSYGIKYYKFSLKIEALLIPSISVKKNKYGNENEKKIYTTYLIYK